MTPECFQSLQSHAAMLAPFECCGLVIADKYFPCRNVAETEDEFRIDPWDWKKAQDLGHIQAVCHSHPGERFLDRDRPADIRGCNESGLPWFMVGLDELWRLDPVGYPLEGRPFVWGWSDCWNLVRDYFGADMPDFPRTGEGDGVLYLQECGPLGWSSVPMDDLKSGDVILMRFRGAQHAAVYVGAGQILHHMEGRLSRREPFTGVFQRAVQIVLRRSA